MSMNIKNLKIKHITYDEAKQKLTQYSYCIVHMMSKLQFGRLEEVSIDWEELLELRAFSLDGELRIYEGSDGFVAQCCTEEKEETDNMLILEYTMQDGRKLAIKEYLEPDEDGQAVVRYTRPFEIRG